MSNGFGKCCMVFPNNKECGFSFMISTYQQDLYCNFHFSGRDLISLYKNQYNIVKNSTLTETRKIEIITKILTALKKITFQFATNDQVQIMRFMSSTCNDCRNIYNSCDFCAAHIIELVENVFHINIDATVRREERRIDRQEERRVDRQEERKVERRVERKIERKHKFPKPEDCPICFCSLSDENEPVKCGHWVHKRCILQWKTSQKINKLKCPICRAELE